MTDKELLEKSALRFRLIADDTQKITTGNLSHNLTCLRGFALRAAESIEKHMQEVPVSEELEYASEKYACRFSSSKYGHDKVKKVFIAGADWQKEHLWKPADGDDFPEIDREVIALLDNGKVVFAHRPPEYWDGKNITTGKVTRNYPKTYDKGGWNIPNIKYWLDVELPKEIEL